MGRFIFPDTVVPNPANPQSLNRYSYCLNNPLKWIDPSGHGDTEWGSIMVPNPYDPAAPWVGFGIRSPISRQIRREQ